MNDQQTPEDDVDRQTRLRCELAERDLMEGKAAFVALVSSHLKTAPATAGLNRALGELIETISASIPDFVVVARAAADRREAVVAGRAWFRDLRQREADRHEAAAAALPERIPWSAKGEEE